MLIFCEQGSNTQTFVAILVAFAFLLVATRTLPYLDPKTDVLKLTADVTLFLTLLCVLMLRLNMTGACFVFIFFNPAPAPRTMLLPHSVSPHCEQGNLTGGRCCL